MVLFYIYLALGLKTTLIVLFLNQCYLESEITGCNLRSSGQGKSAYKHTSITGHVSVDARPEETTHKTKDVNVVANTL